MFLEVWGAGVERLWECVGSREADINTILAEFRNGKRGGEVALGHLAQIV